MTTDRTDSRLKFGRRTFIASAAFALAGCSGSGDGGGDGTETGTPTATPTAEPAETVEMTDDLAFTPESVTVTAGTTVVWENVGNVGHSVTAYGDRIPDGADYWASGGFGSESAARDGYPDQGNVEGGETFEYTFETTGTHEYFCIPHETAGMKGTIIVE